LPVVPPAAPPVPSVIVNAPPAPPLPVVAPPAEPAPVGRTYPAPVEPALLADAKPPAAAAVTSMIAGAAALAGPFAPCVISKGISVDVVSVVSNSNTSLVPVAAVVSPKVNAV
jgi:hypothetical protein